MSLLELLEPYREHLPFSAVAVSREIDGAPYTYFALHLCENGSTRSEYIVDGRAGYFRENICGRQNSGRLEQSEELTVSDPMFGSVTGWVYNASSAKEPCAFLLSTAEVAPDTLPGMYLVVKGVLHAQGQPFEFDPSEIFVVQRS